MSRERLQTIILSLLILFFSFIVGEMVTRVSSLLRSSNGSVSPVGESVLLLSAASVEGATAMRDLEEMGCS